VAGAGLIAALAYGEPPPSANPGDTSADVIAKLGKPQGSMTRGHLTTYYYDRGLVYFIDGHVQSASLVTPEEAARLRREKDQADRLRREQIATQQQAAAAGQAEAQASRTNAELLARPAADRRIYWEDFHQRYPEIDVSAEVAAAQTAAAAEAHSPQQSDDIKAIRERLAQLDADFTASRTTWKRNEITEERAKLAVELAAALNRGMTVQGGGGSSAVATKAP